MTLGSRSIVSEAAGAIFDCLLRSRGSRCATAAFLSYSQTKSVSARSFVQDSAARSRRAWSPRTSSESLMQASAELASLVEAFPRERLRLRSPNILPAVL